MKRILPETYAKIFSIKSKGYLHITDKPIGIILAYYPPIDERGISKMIGAVIVTHSYIGKELIATAEYLLGKINGITAVSIDCKIDTIKARKNISEAIKKVDQGDGVLILTDLFGGSPSNIAFSFLDNEKIEVITGVNLPMILTFWSKREGNNLMELAKYLLISGRRNIAVAKHLMETKSVFRRISTTERQLSQK
jgi:PTS system mannose-specific IIA component